MFCTIYCTEMLGIFESFLNTMNLHVRKVPGEESWNIQAILYRICEFLYKVFTSQKVESFTMK